MNEKIELGSILDEVKKFCNEPQVINLLEDIMDFEKSYSYTYKGEITDMLSNYSENDE